MIHQILRVSDRGEVSINQNSSQTPAQSQEYTGIILQDSKTRIYNSFDFGNHRGGDSTTHSNAPQIDKDKCNSSERNLSMTIKWDRDPTNDLIIGDPNTDVRTRRYVADEYLFACFLSQIEPKTVEEALLDPEWMLTMQENESL